MHLTPHIWTDSRTGAAGQIAGDLVLEDLTRRMGGIERRKGTTFNTAGEMLVGRVCATDRYLVHPELHWSSFESDQNREVEAEAQRSGRTVLYLYITASPSSSTIVYWLIPSRVVSTAVAGAP